MTTMTRGLSSVAGALVLAVAVLAAVATPAAGNSVTRQRAYTEATYGVEITKEMLCYVCVQSSLKVVELLGDQPLTQMNVVDALDRVCDIKYFRRDKALDAMLMARICFKVRDELDEKFEAAILADGERPYGACGVWCNTVLGDLAANEAASKAEAEGEADGEGEGEADGEAAEAETDGQEAPQGEL